MIPKSRREFLKSIPSTALAAGGGALAASLLGGACPKKHAAVPSTSVEDAARTQWYRDAKFGLFLHWGAYSLAGVEASWAIMKPEWFPHSPPISEQAYVELPKRFNPFRFDPRDWVQMAKQAGMRYIVFTTKHCDGFCMFDAPGTDYKITNTPYGKDVLALLAEACAEEKMALGFYYSPPDMHHPGYRDTRLPTSRNWRGEPNRLQWASYLDYMESHLRTLLTRYGNVAILWFDWLFGTAQYDPPRFHKLVHELSPGTLMNDRLGPGGDYVTPEQFFPDGIPVKRKSPSPEFPPETVEVVDFLAKTLPQKWLLELILFLAKSRYPISLHPAPEEYQLWEACMTMNDSWSYNPADTNFKPTEKLIRTLVEVASRGGNFLLDVGPTGEGTFPPEAIERLRGIGEWMQVNGEAIHGTTYGPLQNLLFGRTTAKDGTIYLHLFHKPADRLEVTGFPHPVASISHLAGGTACRFEQSGNHLRIDLTGCTWPEKVPVLAVRIKS